MDPILIEKYNVSVPRYTSYPTVPNWNNENITQSIWLSHLKKNYNEAPGLSIYIHLPFCEALCTYCGCNKRITKNHKVEAPYINSILEEWEIYKKELPNRPLIKEIHLGGGTPTFFAPQELRRLVEGITNGCDISEDHSFSFEAHPQSTTVEHLAELAKVGFNRLSIGVQDVSEEILKAINRYQTTEQIALITNAARELGYRSVNYDIIYGLPFQEEQHIMDTCEFISEMLPDRIAFYSYAHVPWKSAGQRAFTIENVPSGLEKNNLYQVGSKMLMESGYEAIGMDHFCLPSDDLYRSYEKGEMHRNFMGYTSNYTKCSVALGASSISDAWDMYVQNEKHVETYQAKVKHGELPLIKGHVLSDLEKNMRQHILNLMCKDRTSSFAKGIDDQMIDSNLDQLKELEEDGLVYYSNEGITVSEKGKYFIRNVCAVIDPGYDNTICKEGMYSKAI